MTVSKLWWLRMNNFHCLISPQSPETKSVSGQFFYESENEIRLILSFTALCVMRSGILHTAAKRFHLCHHLTTRCSGLAAHTVKWMMSQTWTEKETEASFFTHLNPMMGHSLQMLHLAWCLAVSAAATRCRTGNHTMDWGSKRIQSRNMAASSSGLLLA